MTLRRQGAMGECETRTQGALVAGGHGRDGGRRIRAVRRIRAAEVSCWSKFPPRGEGGRQAVEPFVGAVRRTRAAAR